MKLSSPVVETNLHMNGLAPRLVLTQRQKPTRKWLIQVIWTNHSHLLVMSGWTLNCVVINLNVLFKMLIEQ